jgi:hypothetical protein
MSTCLTWLARYWYYPKQQYEHERESSRTNNDIYCAQKIAHNKYLPQFILFTIYLLQNGDINENQYKMLDDRITEYLGRIKHIN